MIDSNGYRSNVGIILVNKANQVFWGRRNGEESWQFPQGGIDTGESDETAMLRELHEETGLSEHDIAVIAKTKEWLYYDIPEYLRHNNSQYFCGQKQKWYLLRLVSTDCNIDLRKHNCEFDAWKWVDYWYPIDAVIPFKQDVYKEALGYFANYLIH